MNTREIEAINGRNSSRQAFLSFAFPRVEGG